MLFLNRRGLRAADAMPPLRPPHAMPELYRLAGGAPRRKQLACHHCGHTEAIPPTCPVCAAEDTLVPIGPGVERITEEAAAVFPEARVLVMASGHHARPQRRRGRRARDRGPAGGT